MVTEYLLAASAFTLILWLYQETRGRTIIREALSWCAGKKQPRDPEALETQVYPSWLDASYNVVVALWIGWVVLVLVTKEGDFALALVVLTLLAALIGGLDKYWFESRRQRWASQGDIAAFLQHLVAEKRDHLKQRFAGELPIAEQARGFFPVLAIVLVLRSFLLEPFQIPSASMVPSLRVGDYILVNKYAYGVRLPVTGTKLVDVGEPERGDVMVFFPPHDNRYFIKRVIGLPGDHIVYRNKQLVINGKSVPMKLVAELPPANPKVQVLQENLAEREYLTHNHLRAFRGDFETRVKPGHYFMMGDNRDNSSDSRVWGQVPEENIVGKAFAIWMHWPSFGQLPSFSRAGAIN